MSYNFLKSAKYIRNSTLCRYDSLSGYTVDFSRNGDVDGWDIFNNIYLYGCWENVLFGTSFNNSCYIQRSNVFLSLEAEEYFYVELVIKLTSDPDRPRVPTTGKIMWLRTDDNTWDDDKSVEFELKAEENWQRYSINMGEQRWWQGNINNLRIYPFINGHKQCKFAFKEIKIRSINKYVCKETSCDYFIHYEHPCPGGGERASLVSYKNQTDYTTISGISDSLYVNIDHYGDYLIHLGDNNNVDILTMCRLLEIHIQSLGIGGYMYAEVSATIDNKIEIKSGTAGSNSSVNITDGTAVEQLNFFKGEEASYTVTLGSEQASHFDYASSVRLGYADITKLLNKNNTIAYVHKPDEFNVDVGSKDFYYNISANAEDKFSVLGYQKNYNNVGTTIIDVSHPTTNNGLLTDFYINCGSVKKGSKIYILRPNIEGNFTIVDHVAIPNETSGDLYTTSHTTHHIKKTVFVNKGDVLAVYNASVKVSTSEQTDNESACFFVIPGEPNGLVVPNIPKATGVYGFSVYARSSRLQNELLLDIDFGHRINADKFFVDGVEYVDKFEYNIAICEDLNWQVDCKGLSHDHHLGICNNGYVKVTHVNIPYGVECLNDGVTSPEGGKQGDYFSGGSTGVVTTGKHSYFYVNGDGEWDYGTAGNTEDTSPIFEFYNPPYCAHELDGFTYDAVHFTLDFPHGYSTEIHKTAMYFKEGKNFRYFTHQYYVDGGLAQQTGKYVGYHYVPAYKYISLDSVRYDENSFVEGEVSMNVRDYLFPNPTAWPEPIYINNTCVNWSIVQTSRDLTWNVIEHEFNKVECSGYRFVVGFHNSTKMSEFEVYSYFPVEPSLVDNVILTMSVYGDKWQPATFDYSDDNGDVIEAAINISPRYFRLHVFSQDIFNINSFSMTVTDSIKTKGCNDEILLEYNEDINTSSVKKIIFENLYSKVSDFTIDLPRNYDEANIIVLDTEFDGTDTTNDNLIVYKNPDHYITLANGQIANNSQVFALKNLIDNKNSYLLTNKINSWVDNGILEHDVSLDLTFNYRGDYTNVIFEEISSRYLYIQTSNNLYMSNLLFYFGGKLIIPDVIYFSSFIVDGYITRDGIVTLTTNLGDIDKQIIFMSDFSSGGIDYSTWSLITIEPFFVSVLSVYNNNGDMELYPISLVSESDIGISTSIFSVGGFYFETIFIVDPSVYPLRILYKFYNNGNILFYFEAKKTSSSSRTFKVFDSLGNEKVTTNITNTNIILKATRIGGTVHINLTSQAGTTYLNQDLTGFSTLPLTSLDCVFDSFYDTRVVSGYNKYSISSIELYALNLISEYDVLRVDFGKSITVDRFTILSEQVASNMEVKYSNAYNTVCITTELLDVYSELLNNYLTIDLEQRHKFKFVRNYGSMSNRLPLALDGVTIQFSSDDTDEPEKVDWGINYNKSLILFNSPNGSMDFYDSFYASRVFTSYTAVMSSNEFISGGASCYFNGLSLLGISDNGDYNFLNKDFGLVVSVFLGSNIYDEKVILSKWGDSEEHKSYYIGLNSDKTVFFKFSTDGSDEYVYSGQTQVNVGEWSTIEISRFSWYVYIFINGVLDSTFSIGSLNLNSTLFNIYLGGLFYEPLKNIYGYVDNLHVRNGAFIHTTSYDAQAYISKLHVETTKEYRWIKIKIPTTQLYTLDKIGLYPDTDAPLLESGGYNCEWEPLGTGLTDYVNVSYNISNKYYNLLESSGEYDFYPSNVVNGVKDVNNYNECWGFSADDPQPTLIFVLDDYYKINKIKLYHGVGDDFEYCNNDFIVNGYLTASGVEYTELLNVTNNTDLETVHTFDSIIIQKLELKIVSHTSGNDEITILNDDGEYTTTNLTGGFLREIEIFTDSSADVFNSGYYPVVCLDLNYQFHISRYLFKNCDGPTQIYKCPKWLNYTNNIDKYTSYSDSMLNDPKKIRFVSAKEDPIYLASTVEVSSIEMSGTSYLMESNVYFIKGSYSVTWQAYNSLGDSAFCLEFAGMGIVEDIYPEVVATNAWSYQFSDLLIKNSGLYNLSFLIKNDDNAGELRKVKGVVVYKTTARVRWVCFTDNTAVNYAFDGDLDKDHIHYLTGIQVFASGTFPITEYSKWWLSSISELSENSLLVKTGSRSLQVDYPTGTGMDYLSFRECDNFPEDTLWLEKDFLSFWWYIDNINNFDVNYGGIGFGNINKTTPVVRPSSANNVFSYGWRIEDIELKSGWNKIMLQFSECYELMPEDTRNYFNYRHPFTNIRNKFMKSFIIFYKGTGQGPIKMCIDDLHIQRCLYEEPVNKEHALCLSFNEFAEINLSNLDIEKGTISFWAKMYNDSAGTNLYGESTSRTLFSITSSDNDIILLGIKFGTWFEFGVGDSFRDYISFALEDGDLVSDGGYIKYDEPFHITVMWNNDGRGMSNKDTFRLYLNGDLYWSSKQTWDINVFNAPKLVLGGGSPETALRNLSEGSAIFESLKVYNYCIEGSDYNISNIIASNKINPNDYVYLSIDNVNFYGRYDTGLPITVSGILPGEKVEVFIKSVKTKDFKNLTKKTADLLVDWVVAV